VAIEAAIDRVAGMEPVAAFAARCCRRAPKTSATQHCPELLVRSRGSAVANSSGGRGTKQFGPPGPGPDARRWIADAEGGLAASRGTNRAGCWPG
jgi:hypothetical protein